MTKKEIEEIKEREADTLQYYITLSSLESELEDVEDALRNDKKNKVLKNVRDVLRRAIELGSEY